MYSGYFIYISSKKRLLRVLASKVTVFLPSWSGSSSSGCSTTAFTSRPYTVKHKTNIINMDIMYQSNKMTHSIAHILCYPYMCRVNILWLPGYVATTLRSKSKICIYFFKSFMGFFTNGCWVLHQHIYHDHLLSLTIGYFSALLSAGAGAVLLLYTRVHSAYRYAMPMRNKLWHEL